MQSKDVRLFLSSSLLALTLSGVQPAIAQTPTPPRFEDQVVVTPNRSESTIEGTPAFVTLLNQDDIAKSTAQDVPDLLRQAGVSVTDVTGTGRSYRVDLRGFGATAGLNTLVLVDGRPVNQPDLSGADWFLIPLDRVARIEVIRGSGGAVAFGDNATGGVVNIVTFAKDAAQKQTVVGVRGGSYSSFTSEATTRGGSEAVSYSASGRYNRSDGHRENAQTEGGDVGGQLSIRPNEQFELAVSGGYHGDTTGLPGALLESQLASGEYDCHDSAHPDDFAEVDDGYVMVTPKFSFGGRGYASVDISARKRDSSFFSSFLGGQFTGDTGIRTVMASPKVVLQTQTGSAVHHVTGGLDFSNAKEDISNELVFGGSPSLALVMLKKNDWGIYGQDEVRFGKVSVTAGYRYDSVDYTFDPIDPAATSPDANEYAASAGATVELSKKATVFGRASRSFRYPALDELFDFGSNTILQGLVPQRSVDVEGGVRFDTGSVHGSLSVFHLATDDELFFNPIGGAFGFGANENFDGQTVRVGFEASASTHVRMVDVGGTLTFLSADVDGGPYDGNSVPGVPDTRATFQVQVPLAKRLTLGLEGQYVGARPFEGDFANAFPDQDDYFLMNAKLAWSQDRVRIFLDLKNLFDAEYSEYGVLGGFPTERAYYPSPGIHAIAGVELKF